MSLVKPHCITRYSLAYLARFISKMAVEGLDPKTLSSWEHAFQYPIAAVWGMERQLRNDINSNREKLRTLVGYVRLAELPCKVWSFKLTT